MDTKKTLIKQDVVLGIVIAAFGAAAFASTFRFPSSSTLFPRIVTLLLTALGLVLAGYSAALIRHPEKYPDSKPASLRAMKYPAAAYVLIVAYVALIRVLGFYCSTVLFLACYMFFMNIRSWKTILLTELILMGFVYLLFNVGLHVRFPVGLLM